MSNVQYVNSKAEVLKKVQALAMNIHAAIGLQDIMKSNLGPKGTLKMLVGGAGQIKLTKDGNVLLHEMQIQHPTAAMIARSATAQDDIVGDGTTSNVLFIGELMKQAQRLYQEGVHPRVITDGYEVGKIECLKFLESFKLVQQIDKNLLTSVARTSLNTKLQPKMANQLVDICVEAVDIIKIEDKPIDLHMVEIMHMVHKLESDTRLINGIVLDHGARSAEMPKHMKKVYILTLNVSLEYEKTEINSQFFYTNAQDREKLMHSERKFTDERCQKIIDFAKSVTEEGKYSFCIINQKGIDPICLDMLAKEGIVALRRAKRRNMERITLACGGKALNALDDLCKDDLGYADEVYEHTLGEEKYTFVEGVRNPKSCTILIKGPNEHTIAMLKDAIRDGLRAVKNTWDDGCVLPGAGAFEIAAYCHLKSFLDKTPPPGKQRMGVEAFADSLLIIPKVLAENSGFDIQDVILECIDAYKNLKVPVGVNIDDKGYVTPTQMAIFDNYLAKKQCIHIAPTLAQQLLLVDEIMRAGKQMGGGGIDN